MLFYQVQQHRNAPNEIEVVGIYAEDEPKLGLISRWDINSMELAEKIADAASVYAGVDYLAVDRGSSVSPRYDVILAPQQFDKVSYYFNGDSYPCGVIKSISKSYKRIVTSEGQVFYRRKQSGAWIYAKTWSMIDGWHNDRNPHF